MGLSLTPKSDEDEEDAAETEGLDEAGASDETAATEDGDEDAEEAADSDGDEAVAAEAAVVAATAEESATDADNEE